MKRTGYPKPTNRKRKARLFLEQYGSAALERLRQELGG
jgi:hypothetical protein